MMTPQEKQFVKEHHNDDVDELLLHASRYPEVDMKKVVEQIRGWQIARQKLPLWAATEDIIFPPQLPMEQCSSEKTATYKATLVSSMREGMHPFCIADLTGGFGVDSVMMARKIKNAFITYVERNPVLCALACHNFPLLGVEDFEVTEGDCEKETEKMVFQDLIYIDPARRDEHGRKTYAIEDCMPDVCQLEERLVDIAPNVLIKLSPMLDLNEIISKLKYLSEIHVVSVDGECKEVLALLSDRLKNMKDLEEVGITLEMGNEHNPLICCVNITDKKTGAEPFFFTKKEEKESECEYADSPESFLYEPNASILKAGAFKSVACHFEIKKLHPNSHLYTSDIFQPDFPGRLFNVVDTFTFNKQDLKRLSSVVTKANLTVRNFPMQVADLRKRLKINEGGDDFLFATTLNDNSKVLILCKKLG